MSHRSPQEHLYEGRAGSRDELVSAQREYSPWNYKSSLTECNAALNPLQLTKITPRRHAAIYGDRHYSPSMLPPRLTATRQQAHTEATTPGHINRANYLHPRGVREGDTKINPICPAENTSPVPHPPNGNKKRKTRLKNKSKTARQKSEFTWPRLG